jgi:hypothetical protein
MPWIRNMKHLGSEAMLPDRVWHFATFSHLLIVNKLPSSTHIHVFSESSQSRKRSLLHSSSWTLRFLLSILSTSLSCVLHLYDASSSSAETTESDDGSVDEDGTSGSLCPCTPPGPVPPPPLPSTPSSPPPQLPSAPSHESPLAPPGTPSLPSSPVCLEPLMAASSASNAISSSSSLPVALVCVCVFAR